MNHPYDGYHYYKCPHPNDKCDCPRIGALKTLKKNLVETAKKRKVWDGIQAKETEGEVWNINWNQELKDLVAEGE